MLRHEALVFCDALMSAVGMHNRMLCWCAVGARAYHCLRSASDLDGEQGFVNVEPHGQRLNVGPCST